MKEVELEDFSSDFVMVEKPVGTVTKLLDSAGYVFSLCPNKEFLVRFAFNNWVSSSDELKLDTKSKLVKTLIVLTMLRYQPLSPSNYYELYKLYNEFRS